MSLIEDCQLSKKIPNLIGAKIECEFRVFNSNAIQFHKTPRKLFQQCAAKMTSKRKRINRNDPKEEEIKDQPQIEEGAEKSCTLTKKKGEKSPVIVFAHGAGAPSSSDWMIR